MDIRCEKCNTTYDFDESRITDTGINVKCTQCGNLFRVRRRPPIVTREMLGLRGPALPTGTGSHDAGGPRDLFVKERVWQLRLKHTQEVLRFRELTTLRQWILEKRVSRDDDISRGGKLWRRLSSIVELESFFHAAEHMEFARLRTGRSSAVGPASTPSAPAVSSSPSSASRGVPLAQEPRRLRTGTPGLGVGPPLSAQSLSRGSVKVAEDGVPQGPIRLSSTGRTMRPRLHKDLAGPPLSAGNLVADRPAAMGVIAIKPAPPTPNPDAVQAREPGPHPIPAEAAVPHPVSDRPSGAIPRYIAVSAPGLDPTGRRHVLPSGTERSTPPAGAPAAEDRPASPRPPAAPPAIERQPPAGPAPAPQEAPPPPPAVQAVRPPPLPSSLSGRRPEGPAPAPKPPPVTEDRAPSAGSGTSTAAAASILAELGLGDEVPVPAAEQEPVADFPMIDEVIRRSDPVPRHLQRGPEITRPGLIDHAADDPLETDFIDRPARRRRAPWLAAAALAVAALTFVAVYRLAQAPPRNAGAGSMARSANAAFAEGERILLLDADDSFQQAHDLFLRAAGADEGNPEPLAALAELHATWARYLRQDARQADSGLMPLLDHEAGRHEETARRHAGQAIALDASRAGPNRAMAAVLIETGAREAEIEPYLRRAQDLSPKSTRTLYVRALLHVREGREAQARPLLEKLSVRSADLQPSPLLPGLMLLGQMEARAGRIEAARRLFSQVLAQSPGHRRAGQALAALQHAGPEAAPPPEKAEPEEAPAPPPARAQRPAAGAARGDRKKDEEPAPRDWKGQLVLAERLLDRNKPREALRLYQQLRASHDDAPQVHVGLGACAVETEHYQAAVDHYKEALARQADYPPAVLGLAEAYKLRGDHTQALEWYRRYLDKNPSGPQANLAHNNIVRLEAVPSAKPDEEKSPPGIRPPQP